MDNWLDEFYAYSSREFSDEQYTRFTQGDGYSLVGKYKDGDIKRIGVAKELNLVPFLKFFFDQKELENPKDYVPLIINVAITHEEIERLRPRYLLSGFKVKRFRPIDFNSREEFFVSTKDGKVYEKLKKTYKAIDIKKLYKRLYKTHVSSVLTVRGVCRRLRIFISRTAPSSVANSTSFLLSSVYWWLKGERFTYDVFAESLKDGINDIRHITTSTSKENEIDFFGYRVAIWTLTTYSIVVIIIYTLFKDSMLFALSDKSAFSTIYGIALAILSIVIYDKLFPRFLRYLIMQSAKTSYDLSFKGVKIKVD